jgi:uncharacterized protein (TIGR02996 family)
MADGKIIQAFLDDIVAHPADVSLWHILADWLEDHADPRAELVRLTWSLQYEPEHAHFAIRQARVQELLAGGMKPLRPRLSLDGFEFAWIPPGTFLMGSPDSEPGRHAPFQGEREKQHRVTLSRGFWMGIYPVTQSQWYTVMGSNPSHFSHIGMGKDRVKRVPAADVNRFPVERVPWLSVREFCAALSQRLGQRVTLPTEAQWEYACRAGTTTPFHFGSVLNGTQANSDGTNPYGTKEKGPNLQRPTPVGAFPPNPWALHDMHGNVWEWCADAWRADYETLPGCDPFVAQDGRSDCVLRGGSWSTGGWACRAAFRANVMNNSYNVDDGFRVVFATEE